MRELVPLICSLSLLLPSISRAAELKPETVDAWNNYIQTADAGMAERAVRGPFLWVDETPGRARRVRDGEIMVSPASDHSPASVPHGLIHDWVGAAFIPDATIHDLLAVVRDYGRYKEIYKPTVIDSKPGQIGHEEDRFSMIMLNRSLFKTALESEYRSAFHRVGENRLYSVAQTTRVQQIEHYGQPDERKLPVDKGSGYIWRLHSFTRYEERDGGVYVELEAIALSRDIPMALRVVADPVVRRTSRSALMTSLKQTSEAVRGAEKTVAAVE